jgi:pimeloyl-ACP methyl ester carboxylesterase
MDPKRSEALFAIFDGFRSGSENLTPEALAEQIRKHHLSFDLGDLAEKTAVSFENPDFVDCVIHSYRHSIGNAAGEPRFEAVERELAKRPPITVPVMTVYGGDDAFGHPSPDITPAEKANLPKIVSHRIAAGAGHFVPHEKPEAISSAMLELLKMRTKY